jgi:hypothetical protein
MNLNGDHKLFHAVLSWLTVVGMPLNGLGKQILSGALIALCGFSLALLTVVPKVNTNATDIDYMKKDVARVEAQMAADRKDTTDRILKVADIISESNKLTRDIIKLVEVQNQLLGREKK